MRVEERSSTDLVWRIVVGAEPVEAIAYQASSSSLTVDQMGKQPSAQNELPQLSSEFLERTTGFEPATLTLAR